MLVASDSKLHHGILGDRWWIEMLALKNEGSVCRHGLALD